MVNDVGFMISIEDLALGPGTRPDHSRAFVYQSFIKVKKGTEKVSDIRMGQRVPPPTMNLLALARELCAFLTSCYNKSKECLKSVKILPDPLPQFTF